MTGTSGSKWSSTATIITAVGTLLAGLAAVAALVLPRILEGSGSAQEPDPSLTDSSGNALPKLDGVLLWEPATILLESQVDLDGASGPNRDPATLTTDVYLWLDGEISAPNGMVKVLPQISTGWEMEFTIWRQRLG